MYARWKVYKETALLYLDIKAVIYDHICHSSTGMRQGSEHEQSSVFQTSFDSVRQHCLGGVRVRV